MAGKHVMPPFNFPPSVPQEVRNAFFEIWKRLGVYDGLIWQVVDKSDSKISDMADHSHALLDDVSQADDTSSSTTAGKHVSDAMVKKYEDHRNDTAIHHTLEQIQDNIAGMLIQGNAVTLTYDDTANTMTVAVNKVAAAGDTSITVAGTATGTDAAMVNALKADVTTLNTALNDLKAKMRTAGHLAT